METEQRRAAANLTGELYLQGYIPLSSNLEVAAAAVRLVVAGGNYFPRPLNAELRQRNWPRAVTIQRLTPQEWLN